LALPGDGYIYSRRIDQINYSERKMTDFQLGLLLLLTAFSAGFLCGFILGAVLMKRTLRR
jgi:hypothetical protein